MDRVPVLLDGISESDDVGESIARCIFFCIEAEEALEIWLLNDEIPFLMIGLVGILLIPSLTEPRFGSVGQLDQLIQTIEGREGLSVETGDVWLPTRFLPQRNITPRGDVLRLDQKLFVTAMQVRAGGLALKRLSELPE